MASDRCFNSDKTVCELTKRVVVQCNVYFKFAKVATPSSFRLINFYILVGFDSNINYVALMITDEDYCEPSTELSDRQKFVYQIILCYVDIIISILY